MSCGIKAGCKMFILVHQCMRNTGNINKEIFLSRGFSTFKKALKPVSLLKFSHHSVKDRTVRYEGYGLNFVLKKRQIVFPLTCNLHSSDYKSETEGGKSTAETEKKVSFYQKFKEKCKKYWYVLIPFHVFTSAIWFGSFYYLAASGIDIPGLLESFGAPESWVQSFRNSKAGNLVLAYTLYKVVTPIRYTVTLGGTQLILNYLKRHGWIKAVPNKEQIKKLYQDQKDAFKDLKASYTDKMQVTKTEFSKSKHKLKQQLKNTKEEFHRSMNESRQDFKDGMKAGVEEWRGISKSLVNDIKKAFKKD